MIVGRGRGSEPYLEVHCPNRLFKGSSKDESQSSKGIAKMCINSIEPLIWKINQSVGLFNGGNEKNLTIQVRYACVSIILPT